MAIVIYPIRELTKISPQSGDNTKLCISNELKGVLNFLGIPKACPAVWCGVSKFIFEYLTALRDDLYVVVESDYVDNVYRDSYYDYYATKRSDYIRNCVRLSFFDKGFNLNVDFDNIDNICDNYLGFLVLRPIYKCIGRNVISPKAKKEQYSNIVMNKVAVNTTCLGVKLKAVGFPHASQDGETMTCAQTTIWSLLEYFGNKYTCYHPTLPSEIGTILENFSYERQLPSTGLTYNQISVALRQLGFGPKISARPAVRSITYKDNMSEDASEEIKLCNELFNELREENFMENFACYIESGIPLAVAVNEGRTGHAIVCIGRENVEKKDIVAKENQRLLERKTEFDNVKNQITLKLAELKNTKSTKIKELEANKEKSTDKDVKDIEDTFKTASDRYSCRLKEIENEAKYYFPNGNIIYSWNSAVSSVNFVFNDDNLPPYQQSSLNNPLTYYCNREKTNLSNASISHFIAPLYSKIYMEAGTANKIIRYIITNIINVEAESVIRTYLTSSRTYREYLVNNPSFTNENKKILLQIPLPKFVWVSEISDKDQFLSNKVNHLILLDATGGKRNVNLCNILFILSKSTRYGYDEETKNLKKYTTKFPDSFNCFNGNLN